MQEFWFWTHCRHCLVWTVLSNFGSLRARQRAGLSAPEARRTIRAKCCGKSWSLAVITFFFTFLLSPCRVFCGRQLVAARCKGGSLASLGQPTVCWCTVSLSPCARHFGCKPLTRLCRLLFVLCSCNFVKRSECHSHLLSCVLCSQYDSRPCLAPGLQAS